MNRPERESLDLYYKEAGSWAEDRAAAEARARRIAWRVAAAACVVAVIEGIALIVLLPLKTVEPYTLLVDRQTGYVQALRPLDADRIAPDTALTRSFLVQYVIARENFDIDTLQSNYRKVAVWSSGTARTDYIAGMQASNPGSPLASLPRTTTLDTRVKSVSSLGTGAAMVRFETVRRDNGAPPQTIREWVAVIRYRYSDAPLSEEDRYVNPLGFQVLRYQRDQETVSTVVEATPVAVAPAPSPTPATVPQGSPYYTMPGVPTGPHSTGQP